MSDKEILKRLRSNDEWRGALLELRFDLGKRPRGRPKLSHEQKFEEHKRKISAVLFDIWRLNLTTVKSDPWIAKRLHAKFPDKYPTERKTKTGKTVKSSLRKDVAEAMKYLRDNAAHPNMHPGFLRLLKDHQKQLAK